jgi:Ran GTPase-activating protein (RanGAP) involved in mRNA processing and transport
LNDIGFGVLSVNVLSKLIKKSSGNSPSYLELRGNNLGDEGSKKISKVIRTSTSLVHIDLRSNEISNLGLMHILSAVGESKSITSLLIGNVNSMQKNRI